MLTKEILENRLQELLAQKESAAATLQAVHGAEQECRYLLTKLANEKA
jgi:hypothetical protein